MEKGQNRTEEGRYNPGKVSYRNRLTRREALTLGGMVAIVAGTIGGGITFYNRLYGGRNRCGKGDEKRVEFRPVSNSEFNEIYANPSQYQGTGFYITGIPTKIESWDSIKSNDRIFSLYLRNGEELYLVIASIKPSQNSSRQRLESICQGFKANDVSSKPIKFNYYVEGMEDKPVKLVSFEVDGKTYKTGN